MKSAIRIRWISVAAIAALTFVGAWLLRGWLFESAQQRLVQSYKQRLILLPEREAARLILHLAQNDDQWLEILVWASADDRQLVSHTAERELQDLVNQWSSRPPRESSVRAALLARLLAQHAALLPPERRHLAHSLAERLILWPIDGRRVDTAKFIADCQSVLLLPRADQAEIRVAAVPENRPTEPPHASPEPALQQPLPVTQLQPPAIEGLPAEPRRFKASRSVRISDR